MAACCPNCGKKLHWYDVKAECKDCGVSIPNFNWEARLEEDNEKAEKQFQAFYKNLNRIAYSLWGTKLRIVRIILSFIPIVGFIVPWGYLKSDGESFGIDVLGAFTDGKSLIDIFSSFFGNASLYFTNMGYEGYSGPVTFTMLSILFMVLCLLFAVIAFFLIIFTFKHSKTKAMFIFDVLSILSCITSTVLFFIGTKTAGNQAGFAFGDIAMYNASGAVSWGVFVALALLIIAAVINLVVSKAPAKSDDELEAERLARKAEKDEKERQAAIKREKERAENEKKMAQEQAKLVEEAKAKLAAAEAKKNKKNKK